MKSAQPKGVLVRGAAADVMRHTLSQIPTVFGRLVYLSKLRNAGTGAYEHHGLALVYGDEEADVALRCCHQEAFEKWLTLGMEQHKKDMEVYLDALGQNRASLLLTWMRLKPYEHLMPAAARESTERALFLGNIRTLLETMANEHGVSYDPDA